MNKTPIFSQQSSQKAAILSLTVLVFIWGYNWVVMKVALRYSSSADFAALRILVGLLGLLAVFISSRKPLLPGKEVFGIFLTGLLQTGGFYLFSTWALVSGGVGKTVILNYAMPFWVLLLAWFALGERLRRIQWTGVVIALAGLLFILMPFRFTKGFFSGVLALLSGLSWAAGIVVAKRVQRRTKLDLLSFTTWQMLFGSIPLLLCAFFIPSPPIQWSLPFLATLAYSGILGGAVAWSLWFYALSRLPAGVASLGTLATPVVGVFTAWIQLGETPSFLEGGGMVLIIGALVLNSIQATKVKPFPSRLP
ncbi:MAG TPA: EamA family transporter [Thermodesulfobacteriota bacterium]|nr:EamA family transporter [Thermodesulfobacteriota bacterium]